MLGQSVILLCLRFHRVDGNQLFMQALLLDGVGQIELVAADLQPVQPVFAVRGLAAGGVDT